MSLGWLPASVGMSASSVSALHLTPAGTLFAATQGSGVHRSTDDGATWSAANSGIEGYHIMASVIHPGGDLFVGTWETHDYRSQDGGDSWDIVSDGFPTVFIQSLGFDQHARLLVGTGDLGVIRSVQTTPVFLSQFTAARNPAGSVTVQWQVGTSTAAGYFDVMRELLGGAGLGGNDRPGICTRLTDLPLRGGPRIDFVDMTAPAQECAYWIRFTSAQGIKSWFGQALAAPLPLSLAGLRIDAIWPNPVRSTTSIRFTLPASGAVELGVYDLRGRLVRCLVRDTRISGPNQIDWNVADEAGNRVSSGVYLLRLETPEGVAFRKALVLGKRE